METLPLSTSCFFCLIVIASILLLYKASNRSKILLFLILGWVILQSILSIAGFYKVMDSIPPRFVLMIAPPFVSMIILFNLQKGKNWVDQLDIKTLTLLHIVRVPVELVLFRLSVYKLVPALITFEGINFDIFSGISAPLIYYFFFVKKNLPGSVFLLWNFLCLVLLANVVIHAILAVPTPFQQFAFDQPNIAVAYFPFVLLAACVVPAVLFSHLVIIRRLWKKPAEVTEIA